MITMVDVKCLSDYKLQYELDKLGFSPGPILQLNASIILKGNIIFSTEKSEGLKKTLRASTTKPNYLDISCLGQKHFWGVRCVARSSLPRSRGRSITPDEDDGTPSRSVDSTKLKLFPVGFRLAVFGIFIIVIFVYITVERKPLSSWVL